MFLQKFDNVEVSLNIGNNDYLFTMDFEQLYDSLSRDLVIMALKEAISVHRPFWSEDLIEWLIQSVILSLDSAAGEFGGEWYRAKCGVPTGGKLCVYLANIAVFYMF